MQTSAQTKSGHLQKQLSATNKKLSTADRTMQALRKQDTAIKQFVQQQQFKNTKTTGFANLRGRLPLPVVGTIVKAHNNTLIDTIAIRATRTQVRAVAAGTVSYAGFLKALGYTIILTHGQNYASIYSMLASNKIKENQQVMAGDIIATATPHRLVYFSLNKGRTPLDPRRWLVHSK